MDRAHHGVKDATFVETKALPNGAAAVNSTGFDLGALSARGARIPDMEAEVQLPLLTTTELPDTKTMTVKIQHDDAVGFGTAVTLYDGILVQTGAGGAGAAAATVRYRIPSNCKRYIRAVATNSGAGDCSGKSLTHQLLF